MKCSLRAVENNKQKNYLKDQIDVKQLIIMESVPFIKGKVNNI